MNGNFDESNYNKIKKSKHWLISLNNANKQYFRFETINYDDELLVFSLIEVKNSNNKYQKKFNYKQLMQEFSVLPQKIRDEINNLTDFQVFIAGLMTSKKTTIQSVYNDIRMNFDDIAPAPKGAIYSVSIDIQKI